MNLPIWRELLAARPFPAVITGAHIRDLRFQKDDSARDFVAAYLGFDARSRHALSTLVSSLSNRSSGGAFWINGVYGAGKSHLLGVIALVSDGVGREELAASFPELQAHLSNLSPRLTVSVALDDYDAARWSLEEIFWRELEAEIKRQNLEMSVSREGSRAESFAELAEKLENAGRDGLVVLIDELSLFLGGRDARELQGDAAFLQFLGQHARRAPLWIVAALQKTIDDIGGLEPYALGQIRDRYTTLPLALAHLPLLIERRLIEVRDEAALNQVCAQSWNEISDRFVPFDFGPQEWRALAPFHPVTVSLLENVTARFFSRTRSALLFCRAEVEAHAEDSKRVLPDAIWDYFAPELALHPDLRPLLDVWNAWNESADAIFGAESNVARQMMRLLLVGRIGGVALTPRALSTALLLDVGLDGEGNAHYARQLLEKLRRGASFLTLERSGDEDDELGDRYSVDLGQRVGDAARRYVARALEDLPHGDSRLVEAALQSCQGEPLPLSELQNSRSLTIFWHQTPRRVALVLSGRESRSALVNRVLETRAWETRLDGASDDAVLLVLPPFQNAALVEEDDFEEEFASGDPAFDRSIFEALYDERARASLWVWKPRPPTRDEWDSCREVAATRRVLEDPQLLDNRRGRAVVEHLQKGAPAREAALARVVLRLFLEGELLLGTGAALEVGELARGESLAALVEAVADFALPHLYQRFDSVAPRARVLTPSNADALCLEILRRPSEEPFFAPSLERLARHVGEPLGVAKAAGGRWRIAGGDETLSAELLERIGEDATVAEVEARLSESEWGLPRELFAPLVCALLRDGRLSAVDARGQELAPSQIGLPLRRSVHRLRVGSLPSGAIWAAIALLTRELLDLRVGAASFEEANRTANALALWRDETRARLELAQSRALQLARGLRHEVADWPHFFEAVETLGDAVASLPDGASRTMVLNAASQWPSGEIVAAQKRFNHFFERLETRLSPLLRAHATLGQSPHVPPELRDERAALLARLSEGERVLEDETLPDEVARWSESFAAAYAKWHAAQHDPARWNSWRRLSEEPILRALERLATTGHPAFENVRELRESVEDELAKRCPRDGTLPPGHAVCPSCALNWGTRVELSAPDEWQQQVLESVKRAHHLASEPSVASALKRRGSVLIHWNGESESLAELVSPDAADDLREALRPRRRVERSLDELTNTLRPLSSRSEVLATFRAWLDAEGALGEEDEIVWINE